MLFLPRRPALRASVNKRKNKTKSTTPRHSWCAIEQLTDRLRPESIKHVLAHH